MLVIYSLVNPVALTAARLALVILKKFYFSAETKSVGGA